MTSSVEQTDLDFKISVALNTTIFFLGLTFFFSEMWVICPQRDRC